MWEGGGVAHLSVIVAVGGKIVVLAVVDTAAGRWLSCGRLVGLSALRSPRVAAISEAAGAAQLTGLVDGHGGGYPLVIAVGGQRGDCRAGGGGSCLCRERSATIIWSCSLDGRRGLPAQVPGVWKGSTVVG